MNVTIKSGLPNCPDLVKKIEIDQDDTASDVIRRVCNLFCVETDPRMYIRLSNGVEVAEGDIMSQFVKNSDELSLRTRQITKLRWTGAISSIFIGFILFVVGLAFISPSEPDLETFAIVIDAGSSHTSTFRYKLTWPPDALSNAWSADQVFKCSMAMGVDSFADNLAELETFMMPCLVNSTHGLSETQVQETRIFLRATAGMRILEEQTPDKADGIMTELRRILNNSGYEFSNDNCQIMDGLSEAVYGWITTNTLAHILSPTGSTALTMGSLDMGGASSQIIFECLLSDSDCVPSRETTIYEESHRLFGDSLMCYGLEEAMKRFVVVLMSIHFDEFAEIPTDLPNFCINQQYSSSTKDSWLELFPTTKAEIFGSICTTLVNETDFYTAVNQLPENFTINHIPSFNHTKCQDAMSVLLNESSCLKLFSGGDCLNSTKYPRSNAEFFAMSSFYWEFALPLNWTRDTTYQEVESAIDHYCTGQIEPSCSSCSETDCFEVSFIFKKLIDGFSFDQTNFQNIQFVSDIDGEEVSWPLGFIIDTSPELKPPAEKKEDCIWCIILVTLGCLCLVLGTTAAIIFFRKQNNRVLRREPVTKNLK